MSENHASSVLTLWLGASLSALSWAEEISYLEKPVVVTASRTNEAAEDTLASVTVITRTDIERQQARSMQDLLHGIAGINIANTGGPGKLTTLLLRGTESDHVLVLVDGIRMGSATSGFSEIQNYPVELIDRIEIVRGPRSSLYGPEAVGGVIQIFTRKGGKKGLKPTLSFGGGSYGTINGSATLSGSSERAWFNLGISGSDTNGFNACKDLSVRDASPSNRTRMAIATSPARLALVTVLIMDWMSKRVFYILMVITSMTAAFKTELSWHNKYSGEQHAIHSLNPGVSR